MHVFIFKSLTFKISYHKFHLVFLFGAPVQRLTLLFEQYPRSRKIAKLRGKAYKVQDTIFISCLVDSSFTNSLITNDHLNVIMNDGKPNPDVWAIGDAAKIEDAPLPATSQGQYLFLFYLDDQTFFWAHIIKTSCEPTSEISCQEIEQNCKRSGIFGTFRIP